jgi:glycosyltransferase involved in cell wall biosynthesis
MKLSVIIPAYNAGQFLDQQLEVLSGEQWSGPWEVIVADNGSTDHTRAVLAKYQDRLPAVRLVDASDKRGAAHSRNVGARAAQGEWLAFIDADDLAGEGWVAAIAEAMNAHDFVCSRFEFDRLNEPWLVQVRARAQDKDVQHYSYPPFLPHAGGCGLGIRHTLHERIGGFDESLPALEDTDYCFRVQLQGTPLHFASEAVVHIRYRATLKALYEQARFWGKMNVLMYKRYRPLGMPPLDWQTGAHAWWKLLRSLPFRRSRLGLARWLWQFGWRLGRVQGCLEYRVLAL